MICRVVGVTKEEGRNVKAEVVVVVDDDTAMAAARAQAVHFMENKRREIETLGARQNRAEGEEQVKE